MKMWYNKQELPTNKKEIEMARTTGTLRNAGKPFTDKAVNFLINKAGNQPAASIARQLGRTEKSIRRKAEKLGVSLAVVNG
jgi:hypothetical protein